MVQLIKCDLTSQTVDFDSSYRIQLYNRSQKTTCELDVSHEWLQKNIFSVVDPKILKWKQWTTGKDGKKHLEEVR